MLRTAQFTEAGQQHSPFDPFTEVAPGLSQWSARHNRNGHRWGWIKPLGGGPRLMIHDAQFVAQPTTETHVPELVPGITRRNPGSFPVRPQLIVYERRDTYITRKFPASVSGWTTFEIYTAALLQMIRQRCPYKHQAAVNRLVKLLLKRARGEDVRYRQIRAQFDDLIKINCSPSLLLDLQLLFLTQSAIEEINASRLELIPV